VHHNTTGGQLIEVNFTQSFGQVRSIFDSRAANQVIATYEVPR